MKYFYLICLFFLCFSARATHIVGGEFELRSYNATTYQYELTLNLYFDLVNGDPGARDPNFKISIFGKSNNVRYIDDVLPLVSTSNVNYTNMACAIGSLSTQKLVYQKLIRLDPSIYNDPEGFYVVAERCCRNNTISNIYSPNTTGQTFYLEFPPVETNAGRFINSSPQLFPPLSDYACVNSPFYYDFSGTDPDGDSLVYDMVNPLRGHSGASPGGNPAPIPDPAPYATVDWAAGLGINNQIPGNPPVSINPTTGRLFLVPSRQGLFVFAIRCQEFRNGVKIGEVRRDFQLLVINCPTNDIPSVQLKAPGNGSFYQPQDTLRINSSDTNRCLDVFLSDVDANENLTVFVRPLNFTLPGNLLPISTGTVNRGGQTDTLRVPLCFPSCFDSNGDVYQMEVIVKDDGCSLPKLDTLLLSFIIEPIPNQPPVISTNAPPGGYNVKLGDTISFEVYGSDPDFEPLTFAANGVNFNMADQNIIFTRVPTPALPYYLFEWIIDCDAVIQDSFIVNLTVSNQLCGQTSLASTQVTVRVDYENAAPLLTTDATQGSATPNSLTLQLPYNQLFELNLYGEDTDLDNLNLTAQGVGFSLADQGITFTPATGQGNVTSKLSWTPACEATRNGPFNIDFVLVDDACIPNEANPFRLTLEVLPPEVPEFLPANIFTPNNDGINDYFELPSLPPDYCETQFSKIIIFNRWGSKIYESSERSFSWSGKDMSDGVYFYLVEYSDKTFKGWVTIAR